ncbi:MAG: hypothetical protein ACAF41_33315 (plasmid) [Leptolyngbya sp. BL-A-14]
MAVLSSKKKQKRREEYQKKKVLNKKSMRGQAETEYGEVKKVVSFSLTQTGADLLKQKSKELGISASELLERVARGKIQIDSISLLDQSGAELSC